MNDRNEYQMHSNTRAAYRQHYARANATAKPRVPTWVKALVIAACIGLAGGLTGCGGGGSAADVAGTDQPAANTPANEQPGATAIASLAGVKVLVYGDRTMSTAEGFPSVPVVKWMQAIPGADVVDMTGRGPFVGATTPGFDPASTASKDAVAVMQWGAVYDSDIQRNKHNFVLHAQGVIKAGGIPIIISATPQVKGGGRYFASTASAFEASEQAKREAAIETGAYYCAMPARTWTLKDKPDGVIPTPDAAKWIADAIADCIRRAV